MDPLFKTVMQKNDVSLLIEEIYRLLFQTYSQFGQQCRQYIQRQHSKQSDILKLLAYKQNQIQRGFTETTTETNQQGTDRNKSAEGSDPSKISSPDHQSVPFMAKRPRNAYNIFVQSQSIKIKKEFPHLRAPDVVRLAAERYNKLTEEQKQPYVQKFEQAKRVYEQQHEGMRDGSPSHRSHSRGNRLNYTINE